MANVNDTHSSMLARHVHGSNKKCTRANPITLYQKAKAMTWSDQTPQYI
jgi:hypothetical protein